MIVKLLTEHHLDCLSLKGGCRGLSESTLDKMSNCWKSHALAHIVTLFILTSIRFYFTLLAGNFLIFLSSAVFFKINLLYSSQRVKQFGFRSGPIFCWS